MPESLTVITVEGLTTVFTSGVMLTIACWAIGMKIAVVIGAIKKL